MRWEYKVILTSSWNLTESHYVANAEEMLNQVGQQGWELVTVRERSMLFKRRL